MRLLLEADRQIAAYSIKIGRIKAHQIEEDRKHFLRKEWHQLALRFRHLELFIGTMKRMEIGFLNELAHCGKHEEKRIRSQLFGR